MILGSIRVLKIVCVALILLGTYQFFKGKISKKNLVYLGILVILLAIGINSLTCILPPLTEKIVITALGEKNEEAVFEEVSLLGFTVDGQDYKVEPLEGKWFWIGDTYRWRIESDRRQPDGTTRSIAVQIPVGWERTINFNMNEWSGKVEIVFPDDNNATIVDNYAQQNQINYIQINKSSTQLLIKNQLRYFIAYASVLLLVVVILYYILRQAISKPIESKNWLNRHKMKMIYAIIAGITFGLLWHYVDSTSFWSDEVYEVAVSNGSIYEAVMYCLKMQDLSPPLFAVLSTIWYHIVPYGERWLLLLSIILCVMAIYYIGLCVELIANKFCGVVATIVMAFSSTVWIQCAYEYRPYACMLFFATICLYMYTKRNTAKKSIQWNILFSIAMFGLSMTHYFGMLACMCFFIADIYLIVKRQISWRAFFAYIFPCIAILLWIGGIYIYALQYRAVAQLAPWHHIPQFSEINTLIKFLSAEVPLLYWVFIIGVLMFGASIFKKKDKVLDKYFYFSFSIMSIIGVIMLIFIYGNYFSDGSSTLWVSRYFVFSIPFVCVTLALTIDYIAKKIICEFSSDLFAQKIVIMFLAAFLINNCCGAVNHARIVDPYKQAAEWLYKQGNYIFNDDTIVIATATPPPFEGWNEYFITQQGKRDSLNAASQYLITKDDIEPYNRIYLQYSRFPVQTWLDNELNDSFVLERDISDIKIRVYTRKK